MAEAEDVLHDAARHVTAYAQALWLRRREAQAGPPPPALADHAERIGLLLQAVWGRAWPIRAALPPAPPTLLRRLLAFEATRMREPVPATDGQAIWLPAQLPGLDADQALARWRLMALQQTARAMRGSLDQPGIHGPADPRTSGRDTARDWLAADLYRLLEADAADADLLRRLPGQATALAAWRDEAAAARAARALPRGGLGAVEQRLRRVLAAPVAQQHAAPTEHWARARAEADTLLAQWPDLLKLRGPALQPDAWLGDWREPPPRAEQLDGALPDDLPGASAPSARMARRPKVRESPEDEDDSDPGAWMIQTGEGMEKAEDPLGLQRPTDREAGSASQEMADAVSELEEARLVATPDRAREVLLSDDAPEARARGEAAASSAPEPTALCYPEWDHAAGRYRHPGARVWLLPAADGPDEWITRARDEHRALLTQVRRQFEMLRSHRVWLRQRTDGEELDLDACVAAAADRAAGLPPSDRLYRARSPQRRDTAIALLVDASGSTDSWVAGQRRIIDVEREALLLVAEALDALGEPHAIHAFSGEGAQRVVVRALKRFDEPPGPAVARRIAGLEPEHYTRAGAAVRHVTQQLMRQPAAHRLLLLLSDGKPNDRDEYEGRHGVEDLRQAIVEARLQGCSPFCLTIDRQARDYLPHIFGPGQYGLLPQPERLPVLLLEWMKRLMSTAG
ncbi:MAG: hypothetical protein HZB72_01890 [Burkholderiales bacterium]|nr:hypothetical protein [Burkholderiales bacterium]